MIFERDSNQGRKRDGKVRGEVDMSLLIGMFSRRLLSRLWLGELTASMLLI